MGDDGKITRTIEKVTLDKDMFETYRKGFEYYNGFRLAAKNFHETEGGAEPNIQVKTWETYNNYSRGAAFEANLFFSERFIERLMSKIVNAKGGKKKDGLE